MRHRLENRRRCAGHATEEPGCEAQDQRSAASVVAYSPSSASRLSRSFRPSVSKETEPKQPPLRPAPLQVLELPGGAPRSPRTRVRAQPPPLARKYVGKIFAAATTIAGTNQLKRLRGSSLMPKGQSEASDRPSVNLRLRCQSWHPCCWPFFSATSCSYFSP